jgi:hypothetical protein
MQAPLNLDMTSHSSGVLPDGRTVPLAWDFATSKLMIKVAPGMPWNQRDGNKEAVQLVNQGGQYLGVSDEWFRGVWIPSETDITSADYTRALAAKQNPALGSGSPAMLGEGGEEKKD